jgi:hypothetical protein
MKSHVVPSRLTILAVLLFGALPAYAQNPDLVPHAQPACGAANAQFQVTTSDTHAETKADPGKALIYLVEEQKLRVFRDVTVRVGLDGKWLGATRGTSYLSFALEPGEHHLCVDFLSEFLEPGRLVSLYGFTAEAGKIYYFRARTMASVSSRGNRDIAVLDLDLVNDDQGKLLVANSPLSVSHPKK